MSMPHTPVEQQQLQLTEKDFKYAKKKLESYSNNTSYKYMVEIVRSFSKHQMPELLVTNNSTNGTNATNNTKTNIKALTNLKTLHKIGTLTKIATLTKMGTLTNTDIKAITRAGSMMVKLRSDTYKTHNTNRTELLNSIKDFMENENRTYTIEDFAHIGNHLQICCQDAIESEKNRQSKFYIDIFHSVRNAPFNSDVTFARDIFKICCGVNGRTIHHRMTCVRQAQSKVIKYRSLSADSRTAIKTLTLLFMRYGNNPETMLHLQYQLLKPLIQNLKIKDCKPLLNHETVQEQHAKYLNYSLLLQKGREAYRGYEGYKYPITKCKDKAEQLDRDIIAGGHAAIALRNSLGQLMDFIIFHRLSYMQLAVDKRQDYHLKCLNGKPVYKYIIKSINGKITFPGSHLNAMMIHKGKMPKKPRVTPKPNDQKDQKDQKEQKDTKSDNNQSLQRVTSPKVKSPR